MRTGVQVLAGQKQVAVSSSRVAAMIRYLVARQAEIDAITKGRVTFFFAGRAGLTAEIAGKEDLSGVAGVS